MKLYVSRMELFFLCVQLSRDSFVGYQTSNVFYNYLRGLIHFIYEFIVDDQMM